MASPPRRAKGTPPTPMQQRENTKQANTILKRYRALWEENLPVWSELKTKRGFQEIKDDVMTETGLTQAEAITHIKKAYRNMRQYCQRRRDRFIAELDEIDFDAVQRDDVDFQAASAPDQLTETECVWTPVPQPIMALAALAPSLKRLGVWRKLGDRAAEVLFEKLLKGTDKPKTEELFLWDNNISDVGAIALASALEDNKTLKTLTVFLNMIGHEGVRALAEVLSNGKVALQQLRLKLGRIKDEDVIVLAEALQNNNTLTAVSLRNNHIGRDGAVAMANLVKVNTTLRELAIGHSSIGIGDAGAKYLAEALQGSRTVLEYIDLDGNKIGDEGAAAMARVLKKKTKENGALMGLSLESNCISAVGAEELAISLKDNTSLQELHLYRNRIGDCGAIAFRDVLMANESLKKVDLGHNEISARGAHAIASALLPTSGLTWLNLSDNSVGDEGAKALAQALRGCPLVYLDLGESQIARNGAGYLSDALKHNRTLQELRLSCCGMANSGAIALSEGLEGNVTLRSIDLRENAITASGAVALVSALGGTDSVVQHLDLGTNSIGDYGAEQLKEAILKKRKKDGSRLFGLSLVENNVSVKGATSLAEVLKANPALQRLDLTLNQLGDFGVQRLADALKFNSRLHELRLGDVDTGDYGVESLATTLAENHSLIELDLAGNKITASGARRLALALLLGNKTLKRLNLSYNPINADEFEALSPGDFSLSLEELDV